MAGSESDDEDTFVTLGSALDIPDEDEPLKKPVSMKDVGVKDSKGRPRFHGAFTGGFSAGYFNSVGTQEGWTPSTFVSSRSDRSQVKSSQRPEDFMDEDDLGEYGIAPRKYVTSTTFASEERKKRKFDEAKLATSDSTLLGSSALLDVIIPERITIGVRLLRKMGWKEGQGIGPRVTQQHKRKQGNQKMYGCDLPPSQSDDDMDDGFDDESILRDITFAPRDSVHILLNVKDNTKGLGYRGLDPSKALPSSHINLFSKPVGSKAGKKGIRGHAFGVGALEEEDDDIYTVDDMSNYDMSMTAENEDDTFGWTAGSKSKNQKLKTPVGYVGKLLEGFKLSSVKLIQKKDYPPPKLPANFRPVHVFEKSGVSVLSMSGGSGVDYRQFMKPSDSNVDPSVVTPESIQQSRQKKQATDSVSRSVALGEQPFVGSVFDLISEADKKKMECVQSGVTIETESDRTEDESRNKKPQADSEVKKVDHVKDATPLPSTSGSQPQGNNIVPSQGGGLGFKPFAADSAKQGRYEKYLGLIKQGHKDPYNMVAESGHTEWEMEKERDEFSHAARLFKPLATMMAMRFTSAGTDDKLEVVKNEKKELSEPAKAAAMKMYGKLTRDVVEWHPDKLVCKRFNVPDPYPQSNLVGLATLKRDKYSVFNFLTFANPMEADRNQSKKEDNTDREEKDVTEKKPERTLKPLPGPAGSKGLKSIFTHLVGPSKQAKENSGPSKTGLSFNIKGKEMVKSKEVAEVFNEDGLKDGDGTNQKKVLPKLHDDLSDGGGRFKPSTKSSEEGDRPDMDLFRAIFKNTDSESSSDDDDGKPDTSNVRTSTPPDRAVTNELLDKDRMETETIQKQSVVDVAEEKGNVSDSSKPGFLPGNGDAIPTISQRLSPNVDSDDDESYGPALPPPIGTRIGTTVNRVPSENEHFVDLTKTSVRKHKHKHKERHKSKKDKKEKHKKSKHKKKQKKKEKKGRKHKEREKSDTDSSDTTDKDDTDSDTDVPSDRDLLDKMKLLKPGQRMRAADFL